MSSRKSAFRNLLGGMLGGSLGILASAYFNSALMLVAVLLGVSIGWCYDIVWRRAKNAWPLSQSAARTAYQLFWAAGICVMLINVHIVIRVMETFFMPVPDARHRHLEQGMFEFWAVVLMLSVFFSAFPALFTFTKFRDVRDGIDRYRDPHRIYARYMTRGPLKFFFGEILISFVSHVKLYAIFVAFAAYVFSVMMTISLFVTMPLWCAVWSMAFLARVAIRRGGALCLATTLIVTAAASLIFMPFALSNIQICSLALLTGGCSGLTTEIIRRSWLLSAKRSGLLFRIAQWDADQLIAKPMKRVLDYTFTPWTYLLGMQLAK